MQGPKGRFYNLYRFSVSTWSDSVSMWSVNSLTKHNVPDDNVMPTRQSMFKVNMFQEIGTATKSKF